MEILYAGLWGGICLGFRFDLGSANVICRQLDYPGAVRVGQYLEFGAGTGQIWLRELYCTGTENSLEECPSSGFGTGECYFQGDDVGIECMGMLHSAISSWTVIIIYLNNQNRTKTGNLLLKFISASS